jgi:hypothetical protein
MADAVAIPLLSEPHPLPPHSVTKADAAAVPLLAEQKPTHHGGGDTRCETMRTDLRELAETLISGNIATDIKKREELYGNHATIKDMVAAMKMFMDRLHGQSQVQALVLLSDMERYFEAIGGLQNQFFMILARHVDVNFKAPTKAENATFGLQLKELRKQTFGPIPVRLSWWACKERFPHRQLPPSQVSSEQISMMQDSKQKDLMLQYLIRELNRITKESPALLQWMTTALKKRAMRGECQFVDSEWLARVDELSHFKLVWNWTGMGLVAEAMIKEDVIEDVDFFNSSASVYNNFKMLETAIFPIMLSELERLRSELERKLGLVQEAKAKFLYSLGVGFVGFMNMIGPYLWQHFYPEVVFMMNSTNSTKL